MTYLQFHLVFILPPLLLLVLARHSLLKRQEHLPSLVGVWTVAFIALVYTAPWDNYLVWKHVWTYGDNRVLATLGLVPLEEYAFFILQPLLTGYWFMLIKDNPSHLSFFPLPPPSFEMKAEYKIRWVGTVIWLVAAAAGFWFLQQPNSHYLGCILAWAGPVGALQWALKGHLFWQDRTTFFAGIGLPTAYLWIMDRVAIGLEIWSISPTYTTGFHLVGLPIEEAIFFLVTNLLVVQGILMLTPNPVQLAAKKLS